MNLIGLVLIKITMKIIEFMHIDKLKKTNDYELKCFFYPQLNNKIYNFYNFYNFISFIKF